MDRILTPEEIAALFSAMSLFDAPALAADCRSSRAGLANFDPAGEIRAEPSEGEALDAR